MGPCLSIQDGESSTGPHMLASSSLSHARSSRSSSFREKRAGDGTSFESVMEMSLHRVPNRFFLNGATGESSLFMKQGEKRVNQDAMVLWENFGPNEGSTFCGVFDGHGPNGHLVAKKVRDSLPLRVGLQWEDSSSSHPDTFLTLKDSFLKAFKAMDKELRMKSSIDCYCSRTTAVVMVKQGNEVLIGNLGDSRAVLGTRGKNHSLVAVQLTVDLKPNLPREADRIRLCKGIVFALPNEREVARIWLPNINSPGLAMARAFGDFCLKDHGLISIPEIFYRHITPADEFLVLATDRIWDVLSNEEVVETVASSPQRSAAQALAETAIRAWRVKYPQAKVDDCAVVCLFLGSDHLD